MPVSLSPFGVMAGNRRGAFLAPFLPPCADMVKIAGGFRALLTILYSIMCIPIPEEKDLPG